MPRVSILWMTVAKTLCTGREGSWYKGCVMPPNMSHHGGMVHPGVGVGGMVPHQNMERGARGQMQIGPHQHPAGHPAMHGHHMASGGVPNQPQVGGGGSYGSKRGNGVEEGREVRHRAVRGTGRKGVCWKGVQEGREWHDLAQQLDV